MRMLVKYLRPETGDFYRYQGWFCAALEKCGVEAVSDIRLDRRLRAAMGRLLGRTIGIRHGKLIVCGSHRIESCAWPWNYLYEIVPMMWDLWPDNYAAFRRFVRRNRIRTVFCSSSQSTAWVKDNCSGVNAFWVPEAIDVESYPMGPKLVERHVDVLSYGRKPPGIKDLLAKLGERQGRVCVTELGRHFDDLAAGIRDAKISICYPMVDTRPEKAKGVETLTQRYWEGMASGALVVGRAPRELIEVCGYDPVIPLGDDPLGKLEGVLSGIDRGEYQDFVDRNRKCVAERADWSVRMKDIVAKLA